MAVHIANTSVPAEPGEKQVPVYFHPHPQFPTSLNISLRGVSVRFEQGKVYNIPEGAAEELLGGPKGQIAVAMSQGDPLVQPMFRKGIPDKIRKRDPEALGNELEQLKGTLGNILASLQAAGVDVSKLSPDLDALGIGVQSADEPEIEGGIVKPRPEETNEPTVVDGSSVVDDDGRHVCPICKWRTDPASPSYDAKKAMGMHIRMKHKGQ